MPRRGLTVDPYHELIFLRGMVIAGGVAYLLWYLFLRWQMPTAFNPLGSRLAVVAVFGTLAAASVVPWVAQRLQTGFYGALALLTLHFYYLFMNNAPDINWTVGTYITILASSACMQSERAQVAYAVYVIVLSAFAVVVQPTLRSTVYLPGVMTVMFFAYLGTRARQILLVRVAENVASRALLAAAQEGLRVRDEFISIASHELKTPLTVLKLQTQSLRRNLERGGAAPLSDSRVRRFAEGTDRQLDRLTRLVEDMLDISRIAQGRLHMQKTHFDLAAMATEVVHNLHDALQVANCTVALEADGVADIEADRFRMEQVLLNLLSNAMKYGMGQPISVRVGCNAGNVELRVQDHGIGIAKEHQQRIFERFERAISAKNISGMGLGLFICREIVNAHAGSITVDSAPGEGSCFCVALPPGHVAHC